MRWQPASGKPLVDRVVFYTQVARDFVNGTPAFFYSDNPRAMRPTQINRDETGSIRQFTELLQRRRFV